MPTFRAIRLGAQGWQVEEAPDVQEGSWGLGQGGSQYSCWKELPWNQFFQFATSGKRNTRPRITRALSSQSAKIDSITIGQEGQSPVLHNNLTFQEWLGKTWDLDVFHDCGFLSATPIESEMSTGTKCISTQKSLFSPLLSLYPALLHEECCVPWSQSRSRLTRSIASSCHVSWMSILPPTHVSRDKHNLMMAKLFSLKSLLTYREILETNFQSPTKSNLIFL